MINDLRDLIDVNIYYSFERFLRKKIMHDFRAHVSYCNLYPIELPILNYMVNIYPSDYTT